MRVTKIAFLTAVALAAALPFVANAQNSAQGRGLYVYGALGQADYGSGDSKGELDNALRASGATGVSSSLDTKVTGYKLQAGYKFNQNFGIEGGYVDLGKSKYTATVTGGSFLADIKVTGWTLAGIGVLPLGNAFSVFGKLGGVYADVKVTATARSGTAAASARGSDTSWSPNYGAGLMYALSPAATLRLEYERFSNMGGNNSAKGDVDLLSLGLQWAF